LRLPLAQSSTGQNRLADEYREPEKNAMGIIGSNG
jgi:hypothetical protein